MNALNAGGYASPWMDDELAIFRETASRFIESEMAPYDELWRKQQNVGKEIWRKAGALGLLCTDISAEYGGVGGDFRHEAVLYEELSRRGLSGFGQGVHSICAHYIVNHGTEEQKRRFLPRMASGDLIGAIGMTEPAAGSDLQGLKTRAVREGEQLCRQWFQDLHHQRLPRGLDRLGGQDAPGRGRQGDVHSHGGDQGPRGISRRSYPRQDGYEIAGHRRALLRCGASPR